MQQLQDKMTELMKEHGDKLFQALEIREDEIKEAIKTMQRTLAVLEVRQMEDKQQGGRRPILPEGDHEHITTSSPIEHVEEPASTSTHEIRIPQRSDTLLSRTERSDTALSRRERQNTLENIPTPDTTSENLDQHVHFLRRGLEVSSEIVHFGTRGGSLLTRCTVLR